MKIRGYKQLKEQINLNINKFMEMYNYYKNNEILKKYFILSNISEKWDKDFIIEVLKTFTLINLHYNKCMNIFDKINLIETK